MNAQIDKKTEYFSLIVLIIAANWISDNMRILPDTQSRCRDPPYTSIVSDLLLHQKNMEVMAMKNFTDNDYALNKHSKGIVYRFADCIVEVTLENFLEQHPDKTAEDFAELKAFSDNDYLTGDRDEYQQTWKNVSLHGLDKTDACAVESLEEKMIEQSELASKQCRIEKAKSALDVLTEKQRRRYEMYHIDGMTMRQIAAVEGVVHSKIQRSLESANNKINKFLNNG